MPGSLLRGSYGWGWHAPNLGPFISPRLIHGHCWFFGRSPLQNVLKPPVRHLNMAGGTGRTGCRGARTQPEAHPHTHRTEALSASHGAGHMLSTGGREPECLPSLQYAASCFSNQEASRTGLPTACTSVCSVLCRLLVHHGTELAPSFLHRSWGWRP